MELAETQTLNSTSECGNDIDTAAQLARLTRDSSAEDRVELAWRIFSSAKPDDRDLLERLRASLPPESVPIVAAAIARLDGGNPIDELERYRATSSTHNAVLAAEALGRYLADPALSGAENALQNVTRAVKHEDERVRQACLAALVRSRDPEASEVLLSILKSNYPRGSIVLKRTRHRGREAIYWVLTALLMWGVYVLSSRSSDLLPLFGSIGFFFLILVNAVLGVYWVDGPCHLAWTARRDILASLAELAGVSAPTMRGSLSDLRVLGRGITGEPKEVRVEARRLVELIEKATQSADALPIAVAAPYSQPADLPLPSKESG